MNFTESIFYLFFLLVLAVEIPLPAKPRKYWLLTVSILFYGAADWRMLGLLLGCTAVNYLAGLGIAQYRSKKILTTAVILNLALLGIFKYYNFFIGSLTPVWQLLHWHPGTLALLMPLGLSFFTFQGISYVVDVFRGTAKAGRNPADFALFILFFPKIAVGPLVRFNDFQPQTEHKTPWREREIFGGFRQIVFGLFKKVFIADNLALFVNRFFQDPAVFSGGTAALALLGYTFQILCDFSGYSDLAIGTAKLLGYRLNENFNRPYLAVSVTDFWRRWHISLSQWLRDYLYIPLGGNRVSTGKIHRNIFLTMLLGGLWHGANWTFLLWGAWHGAAQCFFKWYKGQVSKPMPRITATVLTFLVVMLGWLPFRAADLQQTWSILKQIVTLAPGICWLEPLTIGLLIFCIGGYILAGFGKEKWWYPERFFLYSVSLLFFLLYLVLLFKPEEFQPFIYNQF